MSIRSLTPLSSLLLGIAVLGSNFIAEDMSRRPDHPLIESSRRANPLLEEWTGPYNGTGFRNLVICSAAILIQLGITAISGRMF